MKLTPKPFIRGEEIWTYNEENGFYSTKINAHPDDFSIELDFQPYYHTKAEAILDKLQESINWSTQLIWMLQEELNHDN